MLSKLLHVVTAIAAVAFAGSAAASEAPRRADVSYPIKADISPSLREMLRDRPPMRYASEEFKPRDIPNQLRTPNLLRRSRVDTRNDPYTQNTFVEALAPLLAGVSFNGFNNNDNVPIAGGLVAPPDTVGDVGPAHYIQYVNIGWVVLDKVTGARVAGPFAGNTFWSGFGGICQSDNAGDPIVLYDEIADRWMFSQFADPAAPGGAQCVAVSTTSDPLGPYARYAYSVAGIDYPKIGLWTDASGATSGYYITTNNFNPGFIGSRVGVFDRSAMIAGNPSAPFISFLVPTDFFAIQPGHLEGRNVPPAGTCNVFVQAWDDDVFGSGAVNDGYQFWRLCPDFGTPANSTLSAPTLISAGAGVDFDSELCSFNACVPQPGTAQALDSLSQFTMYRAAIQHNPRLFPGTTQMALSHTVDVGSNRAAVRWAQFNISGATPTIVQQGTFDPGAAGHRWMPAAALDGDGNFAMGYSLSQTVGGTVQPSLRVAGRQTTDPANTLQPELSCVNGTGVQTGTDRWGDYASMSVDPVDNCTFWFTSEWVPTTSSRGWSTRVCSFRFADCGGDRVQLTRAGGGALTQTVCSATPSSITPIDVTASLTTGGTSAITLGNDPLPAGFAVSFVPDAVVSPSPGNRQVQVSVTAAAAAGPNNLTITGNAAGVDEGTLDVVVNVVPAAPANAPTDLSPPDNALDLGRQPTFSWSAVSGAANYTIQVDDANDFATPVFTATVTGTSTTPPAPLPANTTLYWRVVANNACGPSAASAIFRFGTASPPPAAVLVVDDDNNAPDVRAFYTNALTANGITFDVFNTAVSDATEPTVAQMTPYQAVIWFTGDNFTSTSAGPSAASVTAIQNYMDAGGCFVLDSQDYAYKVFGSGAAQTGTPFMQNYLGVQTLTQDRNHTSSTGANVLAGLGPYAHTFPASFSNFSDNFVPTAAALAAFNSTGGSAAGISSVTLDAGGRTSAWLTTSIPVLPNDAARNAVVSRLVDHCDIVLGTDSGVLSGNVTTRGSGAVVPGASVSASRAGSTIARSTDASGGYAFDPIATGFHQMTVSGANIETETAANVEVLNGQTTDRDFLVDAAELDYDRATASRTLGLNAQATVPLTISNPGTLPLQYSVAIGNYDLGLPLRPARATNANQVGVQTSRGLSVALEAPQASKRPYVPLAPGQVLLSAPLPLTGASPLGITVVGDGGVYVADLTLGKTVRFDDRLIFRDVIDDPIGVRSGAGSNVTTGIAYDSASNTVWWLDATGPRLVEGTLAGVATGNVIVITGLEAGALAAGVEYDASTDSFFFVDIAGDDIYSVDRSGSVRPGYPVPQTSYDDGSGLFGNGLDVIDGNLDVLVGLSTETTTTRSVLTDLNGVSTGGETPLAAVPDNFINDIARSRREPNRIVYVVGNATAAIYAVEPSNLVLSRRWASVDQPTGTVPPGGSTQITLTYDSAGMPFGDYQARLSIGGNYANVSGTKNLGMRVEPAPGFEIELTGYAGADGGAQCGTVIGTPPPFGPGAPYTLCFRFTNTGDATLGSLAATVAPLGLSLANLVPQSGSLPIAPGASVRYYYTTAAPANVQTYTVTASATPQDSQGNPLPGAAQQNDVATLEVSPQGAALSATAGAPASPVEPGDEVLLTVSVNPASVPSSTGITVTADLTSIGGSATQAFFDDGTNGDATAGNGVWSYRATVGAATLGGVKALPVTVSDAQSRTAGTTIVLTVEIRGDALFSNGFEAN